MDRDSISSLLTHISESQPLEPNSDPNNLPRHKTGDILVTCKPFVHIITDWMRSQICDLCLRPSSQSLRHCKDCEQIFFCNSCLQSTTPSIFKTLHLLECSILAKYGTILSSSSRLFLRLYLRLTNPESLPYRPQINPLTKDEITFESLIPRIIFNSNSDLTTTETDELCELMKTVYSKCQSTNSDDEDIDFDELCIEEIAVWQFIALLEEIRQCEDLLSMIEDDWKIFQMWTMFVRLWSYTIPIVDESITGLFNTEPIAYSLYLEPNVIIDSHSCTPNCAFVHYGPVLQLRAMKTIHPDQSLTVNYVNIARPKSARTKDLCTFFIYDCFCSRCLDYDTVDYEELESLRKEFQHLYTEQLLVANEIANRSFLNFPTTTRISEEDLEISYRNCLKLHQLAVKLNGVLEQVFPYNHPEKSRFLFAYTAVEMNLLLFKLEQRESSQESEQEGSAKVSCGSDLSEFSPTTMTNLDNLVSDINKWSELLKRTVRSIRWTHGIDHHLFRKISIPLLEIWKQSRPTLITLAELHSDPSVLLKILISDCQPKQGLIQSQVNFLRQQVSLLVPTVRSRSHSLFTRTTFTLFYLVKIVTRLMLILFAILFPLFIYFTIYEFE